MSIFPQIVEQHNVTGFTEFTFAPTYNPTVAIYDTQVEQAFEAVMEKCRKGVFVLVETQPDTNGKHKIFIGSSGASRSSKNSPGKSQILFDRVSYHKSTQPKQAQRWDKAIFLCDWEEDIFRSFKSSASNVKKQDIINKMQNEVNLMKKILIAELKKFDKNGSLIVQQKKETIPQNIPTSDSDRYKHYVEIVMLCLKKIVPTYNVTTM